MAKISAFLPVMPVARIDGSLVTLSKITEINGDQRRWAEMAVKKAPYKTSSTKGHKYRETE